MSIVIFLIILSALILVHEFGHFSTAKRAGIRVDEFGLGLPPRAKKLFSWKGTDFTLNWLPFGGFVKIFGENPGEDVEVSADSFQAKSKGVQSLVLVAGVVFNLIFAWVLLSVGLVVGLPAPANLGLPMQDTETIVTSILQDSPAAEAGLLPGDVIVGISRGSESVGLAPQDVSNFISSSAEPVDVVVRRDNDEINLSVAPTGDIVPDRLAIGMSMDQIGTVRLSPIPAVWEGLKLTVQLTYLTAVALVTLISQAVVGSADLSVVTGPVGLVGMVGDVSALGFVHILSFTAIISINLALINLVPFPALDGGRLMFIAIESVIRRPIPPRVANTLNTVGFALLIFLMILITVRDVRNIF